MSDDFCFEVDFKGADGQMDQSKYEIPLEKVQIYSFEGAKQMAITKYANEKICIFLDAAHYLQKKMKWIFHVKAACNECPSVHTHTQKTQDWDNKGTKKKKYSEFMWL